MPKRGNRFSRAVGRAMLKCYRWGFEGVPPNVNKAVIIVVPHTSGWDFYVGMSAMLALGLKVSWLGKHALFRFPLGGLMRWLGGSPVDRSRSLGLVDSAIEEFRQREQFVFGIAPEGTRRQVERWRMGFYHIASGANVPIMLVGFDYQKRAVVLGPLVQPTDDLDQDVNTMRAFFATIHGKNRQMI